MTSHDIQQDLSYGGPKRRARLDQVFRQADLVLSVSRYNTDRLLEAFPFCEGKVAIVPNAADDLFFEPASEAERGSIRSRLGVPFGNALSSFGGELSAPEEPGPADPGLRAFAGVGNGTLALVLIGSGDADQTRLLRDAAASLGPQAVIIFPGYLQGPDLRAAYAEATALVFPSLCESFGIPAVEAMAQGCPVALADSSALPEIGGPAGWYFDPEREDEMASTLRALLEDSGLRAQRVAQGLDQARKFLWDESTTCLIQALRRFPERDSGDSGG